MDGGREDRREGKGVWREREEEEEEEGGRGIEEGGFERENGRDGREKHKG